MESDICLRQWGMGGRGQVSATVCRHKSRLLLIGGVPSTVQVGWRGKYYGSDGVGGRVIYIIRHCFPGGAPALLPLNTVAFIAESGTTW